MEILKDAISTLRARAIDRTESTLFAEAAIRVELTEPAPWETRIASALAKALGCHVWVRRKNRLGPVRAVAHVLSISGHPTDTGHVDRLYHELTRACNSLAADHNAQGETFQDTMSNAIAGLLRNAHRDLAPDARQLIEETITEARRRVTERSAGARKLEQGALTTSRPFAQ